MYEAYGINKIWCLELGLPSVRILLTPSCISASFMSYLICTSSPSMLSQDRFRGKYRRTCYSFDVRGLNLCKVRQQSSTHRIWSSESTSTQVHTPTETHSPTSSPGAAGTQMTMVKEPTLSNFTTPTTTGQACFNLPIERPTKCLILSGAGSALMTPRM